MRMNPDTIPNYLVDGLQKQDIETLRKIREFVDMLIEHKQRPADIPEGAEPVDDPEGGKGTVVLETVKCGDDTCHCATGEQHGPYLYRYYRNSKGTTKSEYIGKPE